MSTYAAGTQRNPYAAYTNIKSLSPTTSLWRRESDGELLFGSLYSRDGVPGDGAFIRISAAAAVLNHENLVSLADNIVDRDAAGAERRILLWDLCDAGTLANLLNYPPVKQTDNGFLPESLVWHVGLSVAKALAWLHEGWSGPNGEEEEEGFQEGWMPILHRNIRPENIFFEHPRGKETYGLCKLGNLGECFVSGHIMKLSQEGPIVAGKATGRFSNEEKALADLKFGMDRGTDIAELEPSERPYTRGSDLFALGSMLYKMMTGCEAPEGEKCRYCNCWHTVPTESACEHEDCPFHSLEWKASLEKRADYSQELISMVKWLLEVNGKDSQKMPTPGVAKAMENGLKKWRSTTRDGRLYVSVEDDQRLREENLQAQKEETDRMAGIEPTAVV